MKVKIGDKIYDGDVEPILLIMTPDDKEDLQNMAPGATRYCQYPEDKYSYEEILAWIEASDDE